MEGGREGRVGWMYLFLLSLCVAMGFGKGRGKVERDAKRKKICKEEERQHVVCHWQTESKTKTIN